MAVFPQLHGGPHNNSIAALAVALKQVKTESFKKYQGQVLKNCKVLENEFKKMGYKIVSDGTDTHLLVLNLKPKVFFFFFFFFLNFYFFFYFYYFILFFKIYFIFYYI